MSFYKSTPDRVVALSDFLNRVEGLARVVGFLSQIGKERVLCVTGPSGCGKSALVARAVKTQRGLPLISVDRARSSDGLTLGNPLAMMVADCIEKQRPEDEFPRRKSGLAEARRRLLASAELGLGVAARLSHGFAVVKEVRDRIPGLIPREQADPDRLYVQDTFRNRKVVLHIDHAEGCNGDDWAFLSTLLLTTSVIVIVEGGESLKVDGAIHSGLVRLLKLEPLEASFAAILFDALPGPLGGMLAAEFKQTGSLKPYQEVASHRRPLEARGHEFDNVSDTLLGYSRSALASLSDLDRESLVAIAAHSGATVGVGLLRRFFADQRSGISLTTDILALVRRLEEKALIVQTLDGVQAPGFVFGLVAENRKLALKKLIFQQRWRDFYLDPARCGLLLADQRRCLQTLRQCVVLKDAVGIAATLEAVNGLHTDAGNLADSAGFTRWLASQFDLTAEPAVAIAAARHLYAAGWYVHARDVLLSAGEPNDRKHRYFLAELLCAAGPQDRGLRRAFHELELLNELQDPDAELCVELIIMHGLRNSDQFIEARSRFKAAILKYRYRGCAAFTVLLRFADSCLMLDEDLQTCCESLERAAELAVERRQIEEAVSAYVALSQQHGYHDLDRTEYYLIQAELLSAGAWVQLPAILNNKAVLAIYRGKIDEAGLRLLQDALILSSSPLEEILIRTNILVHRALAGDVMAAGAPELLECIGDDTLDREIRKIAFYNLEQVSRAAGDEVMALKHAAVWRGVESKLDRAFWKARLSGVQSSDVAAFRFDLPFYPVFLSHWKLGTVPFDAISD